MTEHAVEVARYSPGSLRLVLVAHVPRVALYPGDDEQRVEVELSDEEARALALRLLAALR